MEHLKAVGVAPQLSHECSKKSKYEKIGAKFVIKCFANIHNRKKDVKNLSKQSDYDNRYQLLNGKVYDVNFEQVVPKMDGSATNCDNQNAIKPCTFLKLF